MITILDLTLLLTISSICTFGVDLQDVSETPTEEVEANGLDEATSSRDGLVAESEEPAEVNDGERLSEKRNKPFTSDEQLVDRSPSVTESRTVGESAVKPDNVSQSETVTSRSDESSLPKRNGKKNDLTETGENERSEGGQKGENGVRRGSADDSRKRNRVSDAAAGRRGNDGRLRHGDLIKARLCYNVNNESSAANHSVEDCLDGLGVSDKQGHLVMYSVKYVSLAFPFVVNCISIVFHGKRGGKTNSALYVITMNVVEMISLLLGFTTTLVYSNEYFTKRAPGRNVAGSILTKYIDSWVKQGSYLTQLLLTVERYQVVKYPMRYSEMWNVRKAKQITLSALASLVTSHFTGIYISIHESKGNVDQNLFRVWNVMNGSLFVILPIIIMVVLNSLTCIVFILEHTHIRKTCESHTSTILQKRETKLTISLMVTSTILILTATPLSLWVMLRTEATTEKSVNRLLTEILSSLSYFGNGVAFISLMALNTASKKNCFKCCFKQKEMSSSTKQTKVQST